jgi:dTDP-4-dehydrorhamnose reductase
MRIAVTGKEGQVASSLREIGPSHDVEIIPLARPAFDLLRVDSILDSLWAVKPDVVVNAAAYTAVDQAEKEPDSAMQINGAGAGAAFASEIFAIYSRTSGKRTTVIPISTADYPTPARRPANSRLDTGKLARTHQIRLPDWRASLSNCLTRLMESDAV